MQKQIQILVLTLGLLLASRSHTQVLTIEPFTLFTEEGNEVITLQKDGTIRVFEETVGRLLANGEIQNQEGGILATLDKDGVLKNSQQKMIGKILPDGSWDKGSGSLIHFIQAGIHSLENNFSLRLEPNNEKLYKNAGLLILLTFYFEQANDIPVTTRQTVDSSEIMVSIYKSIGGPGTTGYEYNIHRDGKVSMGGLPYNITPYYISPEALDELLSEAKDIDIEAAAAVNEPAPFVHDGQVVTLQLRRNNILYTVNCTPSTIPLPRSISLYITYVQNLVSNTMKRK